MSAECLDNIGIVQVDLLHCSVKLCVSMMMVLVVVRMALYVWWEDRQNVRGEWKYATMVHGLHYVALAQRWPPPSASNLDTMDWAVSQTTGLLHVFYTACIFIQLFHGQDTIEALSHLSAQFGVLYQQLTCQIAQFIHGHSVNHLRGYQGVLLLSHVTVSTRYSLIMYVYCSVVYNNS